MSSRVQGIVAKDKMRTAGLMSGTSVDGVCVAVVDITKQKVHSLAFNVFPYSPTLRREILRLRRPESARFDNICHYNFVLGEVFARAIIKLRHKSDISVSSIDLVDSHGQTIYHNPRGRRYKRTTIRSTVQIGEPSVVAHRNGITTAVDFRPRAMRLLARTQRKVKVTIVRHIRQTNLVGALIILNECDQFLQKAIEDAP